METAGRRPLMLALAACAVVVALVAIFLWLDAPDAPPIVETVDHLPAAPAPALYRPDGGAPRPHPDRAGLRYSPPP